MKKLCLLIAVILLAAFPINSTAFEDKDLFPPPGNPPRMLPGKGPGMMTLPELNLTGEQKAKLHELRIEFLKASKPVMDKIICKRGDYGLLWLEKNPDPGKITAVQKEIMGLESTLFELELKHRFSILRILKPEQQEILRLHFSFHSGFPPPPHGREGMPPIPFHPPCHGPY
ncbi:MAG: Spy/CpxP family protein refolding chaperone [Syntrophaceae bacterium]